MRDNFRAVQGQLQTPVGHDGGRRGLGQGMWIVSTTNDRVVEYLHFLDSQRSTETGPQRMVPVEGNMP